jgi:hypothetical protein
MDKGPRQNHRRREKRAPSVRFYPLAWAAHLAAAFAVFFAVAGHVHLLSALGDHLWPAGELLALIVVLTTTIFSRLVDLLDRWTACRLGAEQLRIARMCLPLLVAPSALCSVDTRAEDFSLRALAEVKRAVRDQGLPHLAPTQTALDAAKWLVLVVDYQMSYHHSNYHKVHCAEKRLNRLTIILFGLAFIAVCWHLRMGEMDELLILTAAGPAFAAAIHGVTTRLGFVHRIPLSMDAEKELRLISGELHDVITRNPASEVGWVDVRKLAFRAAEAMGRETTSWHSQVRRQKDELT